MPFLAFEKRVVTILDGGARSGKASSGQSPPR
jgi:hypothetical protein